jgi:molybdopterin-guanine dinucleotide biosynthesis protein A
MALPGFSCGVLAGGASARMGRNKALLDWRGRPLIARQVEILSVLSDDVLIGSNHPAAYAGIPARVVPDLLGERCPLTGIHALLAAARHPVLFVAACDLPFLNPDLVRHLLRSAEGVDVCLPVSPRGPEPLHAVYSRACLPAMERAAAAGNWKATGFHAAVRVRALPVREEDWAVDGRSPFFNANTPEDWIDACKSS